MNRIRSAANSPPSVTTLSASKRSILWPRCVSMPWRCMRASSCATVFSPRRMPGLGEGLKNTSLNCSRRPSRRNWRSMPNRNSNIGPPRTALGSWGLAPKPMAMVPPSMARKRSRTRSAASMPSQGTTACSMPGSLRMKRAPLAMTSAWLATSPAVVCTTRPSADRPVTLAARCCTFMRWKKLPSGTTRSARVRRPLGIQMVPGR